MSYTNAKLVSDDGPSSAGDRTDNPAHRPWVLIRSSSILEFVNTVATALGAPSDRALRQDLYETVWSNGAATVQWRGATYTGRQLLDVYFRAEREGR